MGRNDNPKALSPLYIGEDERSEINWKHAVVRGWQITSVKKLL